MRKNPLVLRAAYWLVPPSICLYLYWLGLWSWFQQDDFAWLGLRLELHQAGDLPRLLFEPKAQGTIRPWSERAYFLFFSSLFGMNPLPFRMWAFLTQFANLALLASVTARMTDSRLAGFCAPLLWLVNGVLATVMSWTAAYNQALCGFFLLLSLHFFLRYVETGQRRYYCAQFAAFLMGFGALEIMVMYPALAAAYCILRAPRFLRTTLPLFAVSAAYTLWHTAVTPKAEGVYTMFFDGSLFSTLWTYWLWVLGPEQLRLVRIVRSWFGPAGSAVLTLAVIGFVLQRARRADWFPLFCLAWFTALLLPVLPLRDHISKYYLTLPAMGLAMMGAWAVSLSIQRGWAPRTAMALLLVLYCYANLPMAVELTRWHYQRGRRVEAMVESVRRTRAENPDKIILLSNMDDLVFWGGAAHNPFRLYGWDQVYLAPGFEKQVNLDGQADAFAWLILPEDEARRALAEDRAVICDAGRQ